ncbi:MAG: thiolase family protein [Nocardioidaceae bacterium]
MTGRAYVVGVYATEFGRWPDKDFRQLTREALLGALADAGLDDGQDIDTAWFGSCLMSYWGQDATRGSACLAPLIGEGVMSDAPIINVEGGCATGSLALVSACRDIKAGAADLTLAVGVDKLYDPTDRHGPLQLFDGGTSPMDSRELRDYYREVGEYVGTPFANAPDHSFAMDTYAMQALLHQKLYGTTTEQIAYAAAKNHTNGSLNPRAQYRFPLTTEEVLADRLVSEPLTRAMCAPLSDGAAAALLCSESYLSQQCPEVRAQAIPILGLGLSGGSYRDYTEPSLSRTAADHAYKAAGITSGEVDLAEVHDAVSFCEIYQAEMMRFCGLGQGGTFVASGETSLHGSIPINTSGGLISRGHPLAATGISMCNELALQLRGAAGKTQVPNAQVALQENGGGIMGLGEAVAAVLLYGAPTARTR